MSRIRQLREEYLETWHSLAREMGQLQQLTSAPVRDFPRIEEAFGAVQSARATHNEVRDRLALALGRPDLMVQVRYASSSNNSNVVPAKTTPSLMTRA